MLWKTCLLVINKGDCGALHCYSDNSALISYLNDKNNFFYTSSEKIVNYRSVQ
jgi:hypothetical protein